MLIISELFIYPIKALGGIPVSSALLTERGFQYDRRWMLVDANNHFITQREFPSLAVLKTSITKEGLQVMDKYSGNTFTIPFQPQSIDSIIVQIWEDACKAQPVSVQADEWFSEILSFKCRLVFMPDDSQRNVNSNYAYSNEITGFADAYPFLLIGQSSLDDLNSRLEESLSINRFRPNIVFTGGQPYEEDTLAHFTVNDINFYGVKLCDRCTVTTIDQETAIKGKEPLKTLAAYRMNNNKVYFGQNLVHDGAGMIKAGDTIEVKRRKESLSFV